MYHPAVNSCPQEKHNSGIDPVSFYGPAALRDLEDAGKTVLLPESHHEFCNLFAPSTTWRTFRKQQQVLDFVSANNCDLFPFTYQTDNGDRLFLAAHPVSFWFVDEQRPLKDRHTYEIIREFKPCKLYFDLEFDIKVNPDRNGPYMVAIFINAVFAALRSQFNLSRGEKDVLNLDSTSETKFSCHLIFPNVIFENNYSIGCFVKQLCFELKSFPENNSLHLLEGLENKESIENLFVTTDKGQRVLFCDEGVYTKNRHFRLYKSSKYGKNIPLRLSEFNYFPIEITEEASREKCIFLSSLITYCDAQGSQLLKFEPNPAMILQINSKFIRNSGNECIPTSPSPYSDIDDCISDIVFPGRIYKSTFFPEKKIIVYDIIGNRFCLNIGREHKSNNVMYIVDMNTLSYYQKCYDPDCSNFKSEKKKLPVTEDIFIKYNIDDELVLAAVQQCEMDAKIDEPSSSSCVAHSNKHVYSENKELDDGDVDLDDDILVAATEQCELSFSFVDDWDPLKPHS